MNLDPHVQRVLDKKTPEQKERITALMLAAAESLSRGDPEVMDLLAHHVNAGAAREIREIVLRLRDIHRALFGKVLFEDEDVLTGPIQIVRAHVLALFNEIIRQRDVIKRLNADIVEAEAKLEGRAVHASPRKKRSRR